MGRPEPQALAAALSSSSLDVPQQFGMGQGAQGWHGVELDGGLGPQASVENQGEGSHVLPSALPSAGLEDHQVPGAHRFWFRECPGGRGLRP